MSNQTSPIAYKVQTMNSGSFPFVIHLAGCATAKFVAKDGLVSAEWEIEAISPRACRNIEIAAHAGMGMESYPEDFKICDCAHNPDADRAAGLIAARRI